MIYLASPYSHPRPDIRALRYEAVAAFTVAAMGAGHQIFSPIVYGHHIARTHALPTDAEWWRNFNETILATCDEMWVLKIPGWDKSVGVQMEIEFASSRMPVLHMEPDMFTTL